MMVFICRQATVPGDVVVVTMQQGHQVEDVDMTKEMIITLKKCWIP